VGLKKTQVWLYNFDIIYFSSFTFSKNECDDELLTSYIKDLSLYRVGTW
jgi:hypothetical protein